MTQWALSIILILLFIWHFYYLVISLVPFSQKNKKIKICDAIVQPGQFANLALKLPERYSCSPLYMPIKVISGKKKGPCLVIFSVLKGKELNGLEISNRITQSISASDIAGTIIAIPVMNIYGLMHHHLLTNPTVGDNLADSFPGDENGSYSQRVAYLIAEEIFRQADYCIELQTGDLNHNILPQVYCDFKDSRAKNLAKVFKSPVITNIESSSTQLRKLINEMNTPLLMYQAGEAMRFDEDAISLGVSGIKNVMRAIDMTEKEPTTEIEPIFSRDEDWIIANKSGILHTNISLGQIIEKGDLIGSVNDPFGVEPSEFIKSPQKGIVVGVNTSPLIYEGLPLFKVTSFVDVNEAEAAIDLWDQKQPNSFK